MKSPEAYQKKGLTPDEAALVLKWVEDGRPGLAESKADQMARFYLLGYECKEIHARFPEYPMALLLWARVEYDWDGIRTAYRKGLADHVVQSALAMVHDSVRFASEVLSATHQKYREEILRYLKDPKNVEAPDILPKNVKEWAIWVETVAQAISTPNSKNSEKDMTPLIAVQVNTSEKSDVEINSLSPSERRIARFRAKEAKKSSDDAR